MPYTNVPAHLVGKMDRCVDKVMAQGRDKQAAIAICYASIVEGKAFNEALLEYAEQEKAKSNKPSDYLVVEDSEKPSTWHLQVSNNGAPDHRLMGAAWAALHGGYRGNVYEGPNKQEAIRKLRVLYEKEEMTVPSEKESGVSVFKQADGRYRWVVFSSSSFVDREGEIVSQKALEDDTARMNERKEFGTLDWWHTPVIIGQCDFSEMEGRISVESGTFIDGLIGERMAQATKELAVSRSFMHPVDQPDAERVYHTIETFSRALLPRGKESNLLTRVFVNREGQNMLKEKLEQLKQLLGGDANAEQEVDKLLAAAQATEKAATDIGLKHKEAEETPAQAASPEVEKKQEDEPMPEGEGGPKDESEFVAALSANEFKKLVADAVQEALAPLMAQAEEAKKENAAATKEVGQGIVTQIGEVVKMQSAIDARLKALEGEQPKAFRASQAKETVTKDEALKATAPQADPYLKTFIEGFVFPGQGMPT